MSARAGNEEPVLSLFRKAGVAQIELLQDLEVQRRRYLVEGCGKRFPVFKVERGDKGVGPIDRIRRIEQQRS